MAEGGVFGGAAGCMRPGDLIGELV